MLSVRKLHKDLAFCSYQVPSPPEQTWQVLDSLFPQTLPYVLRKAFHLIKGMKGRKVENLPMACVAGITSPALPGALPTTGPAYIHLCSHMEGASKLLEEM